ncbi:MAG: hypothetical protein A2Y78_03460 [Acidobacteria bacterium RBG_13_68_16]|nr:MAG: hypothetical protein A2Y78_03460 [Acidobacteria bacterium RBG_13_68_16]
MALVASFWAGGRQAGVVAQVAIGQGMPSKLFKDSRQLLAAYRAQGRPDVSLLLTSKVGANDSVAREALRLGASVRCRDDDIGYLRVRVPINNVEALAAFDRVEAATMDFDSASPKFLGAREGSASPAQTPGGEGQQRRWPPREDDYPLQEVYSPHKDLDADGFLARHPTWDGRGVTVAVLDGHIDFLLPEMQLAWTSEGRPVAKIADVINATDPREDAQDMPQWVDMREEVTAQGGRLSWQGKAFVAPRDGTFRIGVFSERRFDRPDNAAYINQDIDRNGNPTDDDGQFGVLWDEASNNVWVDTNRDLSFADQPAMTDYHVRQQMGMFGKDNPATPVRESIGFTVQTDQANKFISINVGIYQHGTMVVGALAANRRPSGRFDGVAPGAQIISVFYGVGQGHAMVEGLITAFKDPRVDVVLLEQNSTLGNDYTLGDGRHLISVLASRLIERTGKLMLVPGSNLPGLNLVDEPGLAPRAISVGGYQSRDSYRINFGLVPADYDNMHWGGMSHGPAGSGALKPDVLSPSGHMGNDPGYRIGGRRDGLYQLPPGYTMGGGTSEATPVATGAVALLISAAKQAGVAHDAVRLKAAITGAARWIQTLGAFEQGNGLIQVGAAWDLLSSMPSTQTRITVEGRAPLNTVISALSETPNEGVGIYEREGWNPGARGERTVTFTRTAGPTQPVAFALAWQGNDGTFTSPASVTLPLGKPVGVPVTITVGSTGVHSAILSLTHPSQPGFVLRVLNTVVAAESFAADKDYTVQFEADVPRPGDRAFFVRVPPGTPVLKVDATGKGSNIRLDLLSPDRGIVRGAFAMSPGDRTVVVERPMPGVWEINVWNGQDGFAFDSSAPEPAPPTPVKVTAALLGFDVMVTTEQSGEATAFPLSVTAKNRFAKLSVTLAPLPVGSATQARRTITAGEQQAFEVQVPKGANTLLVRIGRSSVAGADLDLYVFDCTASADKKREAPAYRSTAPGDEEWIRVAGPAPGRWVVVVDAFHLPTGRTEYDYLDAVTGPTFGSVNVADSVEERAADATWTARGHAWIASVPETPRRLLGFVPLISPSIKVTGANGATEADPAALLGLGEVALAQGGSKTSGVGK